MATTTDFDCLYKSTSLLYVPNYLSSPYRFGTGREDKFFDTVQNKSNIDPLSYIKNVMSKNQAPTLGVEYQTKCIILKTGTVVKAQIWDTCKSPLKLFNFLAGSEKYKSITTA